MDSTLFSMSPAGGMVNMSFNTTPELQDSKYHNEVLHLPSGVTESQLDEDLITKAHSLGIAAYALERQHSPGSAASSAWSSSFHETASGSASRALTPNSSVCGSLSPVPTSGKEAKESPFAVYDAYLASLEADSRTKFRQGSLPALGTSSAQSVFSVSTKKSFSSLNTTKSRKWWQKKPIHGMDPSTSCLGCRSPVSKSLKLYGLGCNHAYCADCLRFLITQSMVSEANMPPRCCGQAVPSSMVEPVLDPKTAASFLQHVKQYITPKTARIFCPNEDCGKFIPLERNVDQKTPFALICAACHTKVCIGCKSEAHPIGMNCPTDWELDALTKIGQKAAWKRCYSCHQLASLADGATHIVCECDAEMCHVCGASWNSTTGCPNLCNDEAEIAKRRKSAEHDIPATHDHELKQSTRQGTTDEIIALSRNQTVEMERFCNFMKQALSGMRERHSTEHLAMVEKHTSQTADTKAKHTQAITSLEDRQVAAEIELLHTLEQSEKSVKLRLKHMEAYCKSKDNQPSGGMPSRVVTERDLHELEQQYALLEGMERQHQAKINVMRERQTKRMGELVEKQENELEQLSSLQRDELSSQELRFAADQKCSGELFRSRQIRITTRWALQMEVLCKDQGEQSNTTYTCIPTPSWPACDGVQVN